jgi:hypothetical protein
MERAVDGMDGSEEADRAQASLEPAALDRSDGRPTDGRITEPTYEGIRMLDPEVLLDSALADLARRRPIFHSEADFQHALAWVLHERLPDARVRLELPRQLDSKRAHIDLWLELGGQRIALELKYLTRAVELDIDGEHFSLTQGAGDWARYDVLKDLRRIESLVRAGVADLGAVVALSNDAAYWTPFRAGFVPNYSALRIDEGHRVEGTMDWGESTGPGTLKGREEPIRLLGSYTCRWTAYSNCPGRHGELRRLMFLVSEAPRESSSGGEAMRT